MTRRTALLFAAMAVALPGPAPAQEATAEIRGRVLDGQAGVLPGVAIAVRNEETGVSRALVSGPHGIYFAAGLAPGLYQLSAERSGFKRSARRVRLDVGRTATVDLVLEIAGRDETTSVTADASLVDVTSKEVGGHIDRADLAALPSLNRSFLGFVALLPGIVPATDPNSFGADAVIVNGQSARNESFLLDGANDNDDLAGGRGGPQVRVPIEAVQEFQVLTSQFDAEFGGTTGAVVNAVTRHGGNTLHGTAFAFLQDAALTASDFFAEQNGLAKPDTALQQYGFVLGGPVVRDKAHFFTSVERVAIDEARTVNIPSRPELNAAPTTETRVWNTLVRFDHQLSARHAWSVRWLREQAHARNVISPAAGGLARTLATAGAENDRDQTLSAAFNSVLGGAAFNTLRVGLTREDLVMANPGFLDNGHRQDLLPATLRYQTFIDQQRESAQVNADVNYQAEDTLAWFIPGRTGDHNLRVGAQYQDVHADSAIHANRNGTFFFRTDAPFDPGDPRTYPERLTIRVPGPSDLVLRTHSIGAFAQDKWRVGRRLTVSAGLRYDLEVIPIREEDNPRFADPADYPVDDDNLAPRVGFAFDPGGDGRAVVRGGYGRFYDRTHFELISAIVTAGVFSRSFTASFPATGVDPGPSRGQLPAEPFLLGGPVVDHAAIEALYPPGARVRNTGSVTLDDPERRVPYTDQLSIGWEWAVRPLLSVSADYVHAFGRDQFMTRDLNPGLRVDTTRTGRVNRIDPAFVSSVFTRVNTGRTEYDALAVQLERRAAAGTRLRVSYTLSYARGNNGTTFVAAGDLLSPFQLLEDMRLDANRGPTDTDRRHNLAVSGSTVVPRTGGLLAAVVVRALSGRPFTVLDTSADPDRNGILFDPLPAGTYSGEGPNAFTVDDAGGRNGARGPGFFEADARLGYSVRFGARRLELFGEVFNVTNRANFDVAATADRSSTDFLTYTALRPGAVPRTGQLGMRFLF